MPTIIVEVCAGTQCTLMGAMDIISAVEGLSDLHGGLKPDCTIEVRPIPCTHGCDQSDRAPIVYINGELMENTNTESVMEKVFDIARSSGCI